MGRESTSAPPAPERLAADLLPLLVGERGGVHLEMVGEEAESLGVRAQSNPPQLWDRCTGCCLACLSSLSIMASYNEGALNRREDKQGKKKEAIWSRVSFVLSLWVVCSCLFAKGRRRQGQI